MVAMAVWMSLCSKVMVACITRMLLYPRAWYMLSLHLCTAAAAVINNRELGLQQTREKERGEAAQVNDCCGYHGLRRSRAWENLLLRTRLRAHWVSWMAVCRSMLPALHKGKTSSHHRAWLKVKEPQETILTHTHSLCAAGVCTYAGIRSKASSKQSWNT